MLTICILYTQRGFIFSAIFVSVSIVVIFHYNFLGHKKPHCTSFAGKWFVSTGKDNLLNAWRTPYGASIFQVCRSIHSVCSQSKSMYSGL